MSDWPSNIPPEAINVEQRSPEWFRLRLGRPTASCFDKIISAAGNVSKAWDGYKNQLIAERIFNLPFSNKIDGLPAVNWGRTYEGPAKRALEEAMGVRVDPGGFCPSEDGLYGASPDGYIDGMPVEIKCPQMKQHIQNLLSALKNRYWPQIQGQLLVTGAPKSCFWSWNPFAPARYQEFTRDEPFIYELKTALDRFCKELDKEETRARSMGEWRIEDFVAHYGFRQREPGEDEDDELD